MTEARWEMVVIKFLQIYNENCEMNKICIQFFGYEFYTSLHLVLQDSARITQSTKYIVDRYKSHLVCFTANTVCPRPFLLSYCSPTHIFELSLIRKRVASRRPVGERGAEKRGLTKVRKQFYMQRWFMRKEEVATNQKNLAETHLKKIQMSFRPVNWGKICTEKCLKNKIPIFQVWSEITSFLCGGHDLDMVEVNFAQKYLSLKLLICVKFQIHY